MNEYTRDLIDRLLQIDNNGELISETIIHIRDLASACKEGWRYSGELEAERKRLTKLLDESGINAGDK